VRVCVYLYKYMYVCVHVCMRAAMCTRLSRPLSKSCSHLVYCPVELCCIPIQRVESCVLHVYVRVYVYEL
jgi:hypothetical protein